MDRNLRLNSDLSSDVLARSTFFVTDYNLTIILAPIFRSRGVFGLTFGFGFCPLKSKNQPKGCIQKAAFSKS
jgi:hypothetical protein